MSLRTKFALLLATLGIAVAIMLATALWSFAVLDREMGGSLQSIESVLGGLNRLKRTFEAQAELVGAATFPAQAPDAPAAPLTHDGRATLEPRFSALARQAQRQLTELERLESYKVRSGVSRTRALREGALEAAEAGKAWIESGEHADLQRLNTVLRRQHERIEAIEREILGGAHVAVNHAERIRGFVNAGLLAATSLVLIAALLGVILIRRWIFRPVARLSDAAIRIGAGDFDHRVPVEGGDEIARLSAEVNNMAGLVGDLQEERVQRERFAAVGEMLQKLVHNIRGPLGGIRTLAELSQRNARDPDVVRDSQGRIVSTIDRFESWIGDLLGATRPLRISPEPVEVGPWLERSLEVHRAQALSRGLDIEVRHDSAPDTARFDPGLLEQALSALVSNALEVTPPGGAIRVEASLDGAPDRWQLRVADQGPGIPDDVAERIFQPYFTTKKSGTGIGLALARRVLEQHGGRLWLEPTSSKGESGPQEPSGATFVMQMPVAESATGGQ